MRRPGFTIIELMVSLGLSMMILLIAFGVFRVASSAISTANRLTIENEMVRRGVVLALEQADFWNDYADPAFPYAKAYNSLNNVNARLQEIPVGNPLEDNANNKLPFRRVDFSTGDSFNPNWYAVHDPRSWYRNHLSPNPRPRGHSMGNGTAYWPNALWHAAGNSGGWNAPSSDIPPGWEPRNVWGDYSLVSHTAMDTATDGRGARPRLILDLYIQLGLHGVLGYLPAGTMNIIQQPSTNLANRNTAPSDWHFAYNVGEMPFQLAAKSSHSGTYNTTFDFAAGQVHWDPMVSGNSWSSGGTINRFGVNIVPDRPSGIDGSSPGINSSNWQRAHYFESLQGDYSGSVRTWAQDFDHMMSDEVILWGNRFVPYWSGGTSWDSRWVRLPMRFPWGGMQSRTNNWDMPPIQGLYQRDFGNVLFLNPQTYANNPEPEKIPRNKDLPMASLTSLRYRFRSGEFQNGILRLIDPQRGSVLQFGIYTTCTSYRGARQHWALVSDDPATPTFDPTMGDRYQ